MPTVQVRDGHDLSMVRRAIRERWEIPAEVLRSLPAELAEMASDKGLDDRARVNAAKVLVTMHGQNQKDDPPVSHVEHIHDLAPITVNNAAEHKQRLAARIARLR